MSFTLIGIIGMLGLMLLLALGTPLVTTFLVVGFLGTTAILTPEAALSLMGETMYTTISSPTFTVLPLFVLMGSFAARGGFAVQAFDCVNIIAARIPASLAIASSFGCALFGAICGSSMATAAVFGKIAFPAMMQRNYNRKFALGSIACSGTFACMIPPSGMFILFSLFTGQSVAELFIAGILPGILTAVIFSVYMLAHAFINPKLAPVGKDEYSVTLPQRARATVALWPILLLAGLIIGGLYSGQFTATEAGGIGALGTLVFGLINGPLRKGSAIKSSLRESAKTCTMLIFIIITASVFSRFLSLTHVPLEMVSFLKTWNVHPHFIMLAIMGIWLFLGMFLAQAAVFALTLPILFPVVVGLGYNPIWFCVVAMMMNELAGVSPPVGLNCFSLLGAVSTKENNVTLAEVFSGCFPFIICDIIVIILLFMFPEIATYLPDKMMGRI